MRRVVLLVVMASLICAVWIPWINRPTLWLGVPPLMLWSFSGVVVLTPLLAWTEFGRKPGDVDDGPSR
jgi:hypothetical protein